MTYDYRLASRTAAKVKLTRADKEALDVLREYSERYEANIGLKPTRPPLSIAMMADHNGWPVRNLRENRNLAYFSSYETAQLALATLNNEQDKRGVLLR